MRHQERLIRAVWRAQHNPCRGMRIAAPLRKRRGKDRAVIWIGVTGDGRLVHAVGERWSMARFLLRPDGILRFLNAMAHPFRVVARGSPMGIPVCPRNGWRPVEEISRADTEGTARRGFAPGARRTGSGELDMVFQADGSEFLPSSGRSRFERLWLENMMDGGTVTGLPPGGTCVANLWMEQFVAVTRASGSPASDMVAALREAGRLDMPVWNLLGPLLADEDRRWHDPPYGMLLALTQGQTERRVQFARSFPVMGSFLESSPALRRAVDDGVRMTNWIADRLAVSRATVRTLSKAVYRSVEIPNGSGERRTNWATMQCVDFMRLVDAMVPEHRTQICSASPHALYALGFYLQSIAALQCPGLVDLLEGGSAPLPNEAVLQGIARRLQPVDGGFEWLRENTHLFHHFHDFLRDLANVVPPGHRDGRPLQQAVAALGYREVLEVLDRHMRDVQAARGNRHYGPWGVRSQGIETPGGLFVRVLADPGELQAEGYSLNHCVASYARRCCEGDCRILSVGRWEDGMWTSLSTAEIVRVAATGECRVAQHRAARNSMPAPACQAALGWWMGQLSAGEVDLSFQPTPTLRAATAPAADGDTAWARWRAILDTRLGRQAWFDRLMPRSGAAKDEGRPSQVRAA